jgi:hypothetical protein
MSILVNSLTHSELESLVKQRVDAILMRKDLRLVCELISKQDGLHGQATIRARTILTYQLKLFL